MGSVGGGQTHQNMQPTVFLGNTFIFSGKPLVGGYPYNGTNAVIL
jgi:microcystin-dependent protein